MNDGSGASTDVISDDGDREVLIGEAGVLAEESFDGLKDSYERIGNAVERAEELPNGFGVVYTSSSGDPAFDYAITVGGVQYSCESSPYGNAENLDAGIAICKSLRA